MRATAAKARARRVGLSEAERALWHAWAERSGVVPLPGRAAPAVAAPPAAVEVAAALPAAMPGSQLPLPSRQASLAPPELRVGVAPGGLDQRRWRDLRRGRTRPERTLDLHGARVQEAHAAVRAFLAAARADGLRCVAIVTGRGVSPEGGVLRRELPHWLNAPDLRPWLLGAAHPHPTNPGAIHVLLRRARPPGGAAR
jgi:DNA-nicking Smr family endonuclease